MTGSDEATGSDMSISPIQPSSRESSQERNRMFEELEACGRSGFNTQSGQELRARYIEENGMSFATVRDAYNSSSRSSSQERLLESVAVRLDEIHVSLGN
jgi:hypothetical protein